MLVAMFAGYAESIEPLKIISEHNGESRESPNLTARETQVEVDYLNSVTGLSKSPGEIAQLLGRMGYTVSPSKSDNKLLDVTIPITRADVLHAADIMVSVS
jgi:phenylalanyl-tRNA synthetase beta chain